MTAGQSGGFFGSLLKRLYIAFVVVLLVAAWCAYAAAAKTWKLGPNDFNWNNSGAWSPNGVSMPNDDIVIDTARLVVFDTNTAETNELELRTEALLSTGSTCCGPDSLPTRCNFPATQ